MIDLKFAGSFGASVEVHAKQSTVYLLVYRRYAGVDGVLALASVQSLLAKLLQVLRAGRVTVERAYAPLLVRLVCGFRYVLDRLLLDVVFIDKVDQAVGADNPGEDDRRVGPTPVCTGYPVAVVIGYAVLGGVEVVVLHIDLWVNQTLPRHELAVELLGQE